MNVDFQLPATGALARRLLLVAASSRIEMDDHVRTLALQDALPDHVALGVSALQRAAMQFMLDCDLRCALPMLHRSIDRTLILQTIALTGPAKLTIASSQAQAWHDVLAVHPPCPDLVVLPAQQAFLPEHQEGRRDGVLILDWTGDVLLATALAREFARVIITDQSLAPQGHGNLLQTMGLCLFPDMNSQTIGRTYRQMAALLNVFLPEFATQSGYFQG